MNDFRDLRVWQGAHDVAVEVYRATAGFPSDERYGLTQQMRRAAVSIPANIAEGCGRRSGAEFGRFLEIAMGSAAELDYYLILCGDLGYLPKEAAADLAARLHQTMRMLNVLLQRVQGRTGGRKGGA